MINVTQKNILKRLSEYNKEFFTIQEIQKVLMDELCETKCELVESNGVIVNPETRLVTINGVDHRLPKKLFNLLYYLIQNKNKTITRSKILNDIWGTDIIVEERTVDTHIRKLRKILPQNFIKTNQKIGYLWEDK